MSILGLHPSFSAKLRMKKELVNLKDIFRYFFDVMHPLRRKLLSLGRGFNSHQPSPLYYQETNAFINSRHRISAIFVIFQELPKLLTLRELIKEISYELWQYLLYKKYPSLGIKEGICI